MRGRLSRGSLFLLIVGCALGAFSLTFTHLAGSLGGPGFEDGIANEARFKSNAGVALDAVGNIYVADTGNHTIRRISSSGAVTTLAGLAETAGAATGRGAHARFNAPAALVVAGGVIYVADTGNHAIRKLETNGITSDYVGYPGVHGFANGSSIIARFNGPRGITMDGSGNLYVADTGNHAIRQITAGGVVSTLAGTGSFGNANGVGTGASFHSPNGIVYHAASNALYVADAGNNVVRRITLPGAVVTTFAGTMGTAGHADGSPGFFYTPTGITVDSGGTFYVTDSSDHTIRSITSGGTVGTAAGFPFYPGPQDSGVFGPQFRSPMGLAAMGASDLYVADTGNHTVRKVTIGGSTSTFAGLANASGGPADATGSVARFDRPAGMASYPGPTLATSFTYVADTGNHAIRRVFGDGQVQFVAGGGPGYGNGVGNAAQFNHPEGLALRFSDLTVFVADRNNHCIRMVDYSGTVSLYAGQATLAGSTNGDRLTTARFNLPRAVAFNNGHTALYVADSGNYRVRRIDLGTGVVSTLAGSGSFGTADGNGTSASLGVMTGLSVDASDNVYVAEAATGTIRKIETDGDVTTIAGTAYGCCGAVDGVGAAARFGYPGPSDIEGGYIADPFAHLIRTIDVGTATVGTAGGKAGVNGTSPGTGSFARFNSAAYVGTAYNGIVIAEGHTIRYGGPEIPDRAVIDSAAGLVGNERQLDMAPQTATSWEWTVIRRPAGSTAMLSSTTVRNPTFKPDVPDMYVFRCKATNASGSSISTVTLNGNDPASYLTVGYPGPLLAGESVAVAVIARDPWSNIADGYTGTVHFTSSDDTAVLPADVTFTAGDHGARSAIVTLKRSGFQTITVTDTVSGITGTGTFYVYPADASALTVTMSATAGAGNPADVTVTAHDPYGNVASGYGGTVHFTSSDGAATLPSNYTFLNTDEGVHTFPLGVTLRTQGPQSVTATDTIHGAITGSVNVSVGPSIPASFTASRSGANIFLAWGAAAGADHYDIHRASPTSGGYVLLASTFDPSYLDTTALPNTVYAYKVRAVGTGGHPSPFSTPDLATTIVFTDDPLVASTTKVKAVHITQLRTAVQSLRACAGLAAMAFTDPTVTTTTKAKKAHIDELRTGLSAARTALGLPVLAFTDPTLVVNSTLVRRLHLSDLRTAVK